MTYDVILTTTATRQAKDSVQWWSRHRSAEQARRWYDGLFQALTHLQTEPDRFPLARESDEFPFELRELLYGLRNHKTHRVLFGIDRDQVTVYAILHVAQDDLTFDDL